MKTNEETRVAILKASETLFMQYGLNKTTMGEIARDCDMSPANIYRFFKSKNDIAAELATKCLGDETAALREVARNRDRTPSERIRDFVFKAMELNREVCDNYPKIREMVGFIESSRMDIIETHIAEKQSIMAEILADGAASGEFEICDVATTAEYLLKAFIMFGYPPFMESHDRADLERYADGVVNLVLNGLLSRG